MAVKLLDLKAQYEQIRAEVREAVDRVLESQMFILGGEVTTLEKQIAEYSHCTEGVGVSSGTDALVLALMALSIRPGDEVIIPAQTFFATAGSVARLYAKPVCVDVDPITCNIDPAKIEAAITPRTKAIIAVHLFGQTADMDPIMEIANRHGLKVIEDSAQSIGSEYKGRRAGSLGHVGCMSFFPSKNLGAAGDGGMITTNDAEIADRCRLLRTQGYRPKYRNIAVGGNFRLDPIQAAILQVKLRYLDGWSAGRQRNADLYRKYLGEAGLLLSDWKGGSVKGQKGVATLTDMKYGAHVYNQFIIHAGERDALMNFLKERGIGSEIYYPVPVHLQDCFSDKVRYTNLPYKADEFCFYMNLGYKEGDFPHSEVSADESLGLPIYPELTDAMIQEVVQGVADFFKG